MISMPEAALGEMATGDLLVLGVTDTGAAPSALNRCRLSVQVSHFILELNDLSAVVRERTQRFPRRQYQPTP